MRERYYTLAESAEYVGLSLSSLKKYVHFHKILVPDKSGGKGGCNLFAQSTLDSFKKIPKRKVGRPVEPGSIRSRRRMKVT